MSRVFISKCTLRALLSVMAMTLMAGFLYSPSAQAFEEYGGVDNCEGCHGDFRTGPYTSLADGQSWGDDLHDVHRNTMLGPDSSRCNVCHSSGSRSPVFLGSSVGGTGFDPISCVGCHGRDEDIGGDGTSPGRGAGLRQHHFNAAETVCADCHDDADPGSFDAAGEDVLPPYYFLPDEVYPNKPTDSCIAAEEDYAGSPIGLDNDGDGLYDGSDPHCAGAVCGNGVMEAGEDCDDGNTDDGDCCNSTCQFDPVDTLCSDGLVCNGEETCDGAGACESGVALDCGDGVSCTDDSCSENVGGCVNQPIDALCTDSLFCNGTETCNAVSGCQSSGDPCPPGEVCTEEGSGMCQVATACGNGNVETDEQCDDGNTLNGDCCDSTCQFESSGSSCENGMFCDGNETCNGSGTCQSGTAVDCNDGVSCTVDSCDEGANACANQVDDASCADTTFCNGVEFCHPVDDCQAGPPVDCNDNVGCTIDSCDATTDACLNEADDTQCSDDGMFCTGTEFCDLANDCSSTGDPCPAGETCTETGTGMCEVIVGAACGNGDLEAGEQCDDGNTLNGDCCDANCQFESDGSSCADGTFCNGDETCNGAGTCLPGIPDDCSDGVDCSSDTCDEVNDRCVNTPNDNNCVDDGLFCTGQEICSLNGGCVSTGDPCASGTTCNEATGSCDVVDNGKVEICHKGRTIEVSQNAVRYHLKKHRDTLGACPPPVEICHKGRTIEVAQKDVNYHLKRHGDTLGECPPPPPPVEICHKGRTVEVAQKKVNYHLKKHRDTLGACPPPPPPVEICHKGRTMEVGQDRVNYHLKKHRDTLGPCRNRHSDDSDDSDDSDSN